MAYHGGRYHGWQIQPNAITVQQQVEDALLLVTRQQMRLTGAGRTDTGVHARQFYAHFDFESLLDEPSLKQWAYRLNRILSPDIVVFQIHRVSVDFHARFSATSRTYRYYLLKTKDPFNVDFAYRPGVALDVEKMQTAVGIFMEYEDFTCFTKSNTQVNNYLCRVTASRLIETETMLIYHVAANRFLRNMVRAMVGTLLEAGKGRISEQDLRVLLTSGTRSDAGESVPAKGLFLESIEYPENSFGSH